MGNGLSIGETPAEIREHGIGLGIEETPAEMREQGYWYQYRGYPSRNEGTWVLVSI